METTSGCKHGGIGQLLGPPPTTQQKNIVIWLGWNSIDWSLGEHAMQAAEPGARGPTNNPQSSAGPPPIDHARGNQELRTCREFAAVVQFARLLGPKLKITPFPADLLEHALLVPASYPLFLGEIVVRLIRSDVPDHLGEELGQWEELLAQRAGAVWRGSPEANPLQDAAFADLSAVARVSTKGWGAERCDTLRCLPQCSPDTRTCDAGKAAVCAVRGPQLPACRGGHSRCGEAHLALSARPQPVLNAPIHVACTAESRSFVQRRATQTRLRQTCCGTSRSGATPWAVCTSFSRTAARTAGCTGSARRLASSILPSTAPLRLARCGSLRLSFPHRRCRGGCAGRSARPRDELEGGVHLVGGGGAAGCQLCRQRGRRGAGAPPEARHRCAAERRAALPSHRCCAIRRIRR